MDAALQNINKAVVKAVHLARTEMVDSVIDKMTEFLSEKIELDEEMHQYFAEFRTSLKATVAKEEVALRNEATKKLKATKKDRGATGLKPLTINNLFIQDKMAELKASGVKADPEKGNVLKQATAFWRELTADDKKKYEEDNRHRLDELNKARAEKSA